MHKEKDNLGSTQELIQWSTIQKEFQKSIINRSKVVAESCIQKDQLN